MLLRKPFRVTAVKIDRKRRCLIMEYQTLNFIERGSRLYCGCCGKIFATVTEYINFPFNFCDLDKILIDKNYEATDTGLIHTTCGENISPLFSAGANFVSLHTYLTTRNEH